jgi:uncharacterized protein
VPRVSGLWRYPVKSLRGERVEASEIGRDGLVGDRAFGIVDEATGHVLTARREPRLLFAAARWHHGHVEIIGPQGLALDTDDALSGWLGRRVHLARAGAQGGVYENPQDSEHETDWLAWRGPGRAWHDSKRTRVSLVSTGTLGAWAVERFRPNVLLDGAGEEALVGEQVRLGTATLDVTQRVGRCVMVTRAQPGLEVDRDVLRRIHRERSGELAVGALVVAPGTVAVGDQLSRLA